jgi:Xaa-Pro aminopeptidase
LGKIDTHAEQRQKTSALLREKGITRALFANWESVHWLTGFAPPVQLGPNLFENGPAAVWYEAGQYTLITVDSFADQTSDFASDGQVILYPGYTIDEPIAGGDRQTKALTDLLKASGSGALGIEQNHASALMLATLSSDFTPIDGWLKPLRMVKTAEELANLRKNFALTDVGHAVARQATAPGKTEIEIWGTIQAAIQNEAGFRVPLGNDCVVSSRSPNNIGGWPLDYELRPGHSLMVDLSTVVDGYWSDSCMTYYASEPSSKQVKMHQTARDALDFAASLLRPGAVAKDIDQKVRQFMSDAGYPVYPHHTGHGVGVSGHEEPRIVPYNDAILQQGMVIMLEPGIYFPGAAAVRVEDAFLVTADGCEVLTHHDKSIRS